MPENWDSMTLNQVAHTLAVFAAPAVNQTGLIDRPDVALFWKRLQIFKALTGFTDLNLHEWQAVEISLFYKETQLLDSAAAIAYFQDKLRQLVEKTTAFMLIQDAKTGAYFLNSSLCVNPLYAIKLPMPSARTGKPNKNGAPRQLLLGNYYPAVSSADDPLSNVSLEELSRLFSSFEAYHADGQNIEHLHTMTAVLYRPLKSRYNQNTDTDRRRPLEVNEAVIQDRAEKIAAIFPLEILRVIEFYIASCRAQFARMYPEIFKPKSQNTEGGDWLDFVLALSDFDPTKKDKVMSDNAHDMLELACRSIRNNKRQMAN